MKKITVALSLSVAFALGCLASGQLISSADAQVATPGLFTECVGATLNAVPGRELSRSGSTPNTLRIPSGWTPIGAVGPARTAGVGTSSSGGGVLVICR